MRIFTLTALSAVIVATAASAQVIVPPAATAPSVTTNSSIPQTVISPTSLLPAPPASTFAASASTTSPGASLTSSPSTVSPTVIPPGSNNITTVDGYSVPVFATGLFSGAFSGTRPADRPDYIIQIGDQISINLYGAISDGGIRQVDASGAVFIPGVGAVPVAGQTARNLQSVIAGKIHTVYTSSVGVYATVVQAGSLGVYVTGDVRRPGRYVGGAHDSVLFYLDQAGGIDPQRGSFRKVELLRGGVTIQTFDLYDFELKGKLNEMTFKEGDTIVVGPRGAMVGVTGSARNAFAFEAPYGAKSMTGADLIPLMRPEPTINGAALHGFRGGKPQEAYYSLADLARVVLTDGDHVELRSDVFTETVTIKIDGEIKGPSVYVLPRGATLSQLMAKIPLDGTDVEPRFVHISRPSVAAQQKEALTDSLDRLQRQILTTAPASSEQAALITSQASLLAQYVTKAEQAVPDGNVVVYVNGKFNDIRLLDGDTVVLPNRTDVVSVTGEIMTPGALSYSQGASIKDYAARAGGATPNANLKKIVLLHLDGSANVVPINTKPGPGDQVVLVPKVGNFWLQWTKDITSIIFQLALTAASINNVTNN
jgi:protein involved in polysaccharide export with SLBB domain